MTRVAVDLFAGAGGMSLGFSQSGFTIGLAVEKDAWAANTFGVNHPNTKLMCRDVRELCASDFVAFDGVDVVMGGPPCQGFSISASNRRKPQDARNFLYRDFVAAVEMIRPRAVLIENVKELTRYRLESGSLLCDDIIDRLAAIGFSAAVLTLDAADYGVPQSRTRAFIIGCRNRDRLADACLALKTRGRTDQRSLFATTLHRRWTLWDAISDLPEVAPHQFPEDAELSYACDPGNELQKHLRGNSFLATHHIPMRHTPRMVSRFKHILESGSSTTDYPDVVAPRKRSDPGSVSTRSFHQNHRRLMPDRPAPTITASFYSSFVHPYQPRNLTVREAARLQTFPDTFTFRGKRTTLSKKLLARKGINEDLHLDQFNQVGNSVPPMLAQTIAEVMADTLL